MAKNVYVLARKFINPKYGINYNGKDNFDGISESDTSDDFESVITNLRKQYAKNKRKTNIIASGLSDDEFTILKSLENAIQKIEVKKLS